MLPASGESIDSVFGGVLFCLQQGSDVWGRAVDELQSATPIRVRQPPLPFVPKSPPQVIACR
jgi:hypothetical protein